jgi:hypothetical protein
MSEDDEDSYRREAERFFWLVGYAIAEWAHVDRALFDLCKWTLNTSDEKTAVIFYKNPSMGDHLSTVNELMKISLGIKRSPVWAKIHKKTYDLLPFRNDIAHDPATQVVQLYGHFKKPGEEWKEPPVSPPPESGGQSKLNRENCSEVLGLSMLERKNCEITSSSYVLC